MSVLDDTFEAMRTNIFKRFMKQTTADQEDVTSGLVDSTIISQTFRQWEEAFALPLDRRSRYDDFDDMDKGDVSVMLDAVVDQALQFEEVTSDDEDLLQAADCFKLDVSAPAKVKEVIRQVLENTEIRDELPAIARDLLKYGDEFVELIFNDNDEIAAIQPHSVREMFVTKDNHGRFDLGKDDQGFTKAIQQRDLKGATIAGWQPFEVLHFRLFPTKKKSYSLRGFLDTIRWDAKKLQWLEQGMVLARATRAYPRLVWTRDMTGKTTKDAETKMASFIRSITRKHTASGAMQSAPMNPDEDYFIATGYVTGSDGKNYQKLDNIQMLDPNLNGLGTITDITYMRRKLFNKVPSSTVGIVDANQGDMTPQDIALGRFTRHFQSQLEKGLRQLLDTALRAQGYLNVKYRVIWPRPSIHTDWRYADGRFRSSMADQNYNAMGVISKDTIRKREFGMTDEESAAEAEKVLAEIKEMGTLFPTNSGQGEGEGTGVLGATPEGPQAPEEPDTSDDANKKSKQRTGGQNSGTKASKESINQRHIRQNQMATAFPPPMGSVPPTVESE
jgi:hypothetical protein